MITQWTERIGWEEFVLECGHHPKTNGLGATQRAIVAYLATAPAGFKCRGCGHRECEQERYHDAANAYRASAGYGAEATALWHGPPHAIRLDCITRAVYVLPESAGPTASQTRVVQRGVRRLEELGLAECEHGTGRFIERSYTTCQGRPAVMPQAVHALFVALRWDCEHLRRQEELVDLYEAEQGRRVGEMFARMFPPATAGR